MILFGELFLFCLFGNLSTNKQMKNNDNFSPTGQKYKYQGITQGQTPHEYKNTNNEAILTP